MRASLSVKGLSALYSTGEGVREANFTLEEGEIGVIVGRNGAGKTTLLRALATLIPHRGEVRVGDIGQDDGKDFRRAVSFLPDDPGLPSWLSGDEIAEWVADLWEEAGYLETFKSIAGTLFPDLQALRRHTQTFSRGMTQKLGIAVTLARRAKLYMLDEPDAYLDALSRATLERLLVQNTRNGSMVLISTHDPDMAVRLARRLFAVEEGIVHEFTLADGPKAIIDLLSGDVREELSD